MLQQAVYQKMVVHLCLYLPLKVRNITPFTVLVTEVYMHVHVWSVLTT